VIEAMKTLPQPKQEGRQLKTTAGLITIATILIAAVAQSAEIIVHVHDVPDAKGRVIATLTNSNDAWTFKAPLLWEKRLHAVKGQWN
jgi:hypothetical protein